jgi:hypothetical protein
MERMPNAMPTTLFEAKPVDPREERRKKLLIWTATAVVLLGLVLAGVWWLWFQYWPEERAADKFFASLQAGNMQQAYALWMADPNWQAHPQQYARYPFGQFENDWGKGGEWGVIRSYKVEGAAPPPKTTYSTGSFVVVVVTVNGRTDKACLAVQKSDKSLGFSPDSLVRIRTEEFNCK